MFFISIDCIKNTGGLKLFFDRCNNDVIGLKEFTYPAFSQLQ
jgi:hypothetical protein